MSCDCGYKCVKTDDCQTLQKMINCLNEDLEFLSIMHDLPAELTVDRLRDIACLLQNVKDMACELQKTSKKHEARLQKIEEVLKIKP